MFSFGNPNALYLLILIPIILGIFIIARRRRIAGLKKFGNPEVIAGLMPDVSPYKPWIKITLQLLALLMIIIVIARPRAGSKEQTVKVRGIEVMVALDVSNSMLASSTDDVKGVSRLQRSKLLLEKLIDKFVFYLFISADDSIFYIFVSVNYAIFDFFVSADDLFFNLGLF